MKVKYLIIVFFLINVSFAQKEIIPTQPINDTFYIYELIQNLSMAVKSDNVELLNKLILYGGNNTTANIPGNKSVITRKLNLKNVHDIQIKLDKILSLTTLTAKLLINLYLFNPENFEKVTLELNLVKNEGFWFIEEDPKNYNLLQWILENKFIVRETENLKSFQIRHSNSTLIQMRYSSTPVIWEINKNITNQYIQRDLFAPNSELDVELYWFGNNWPNDVATFILDPVWDRIIYAKENTSKIKSYGDNLNDSQFFSPSAITMDHNGNIYVVDTGNRRIVKLWYDPNANQIYFNTTLMIPNLKNPKDIIYTSGGYGNPPRLWILDGPGGPLIITDEFGQVLNVVNQYKYNGVVFNFNNPTRLVCQRQGFQPFILDPSSKTLMHGYVDTYNIFNVIKLTQFPPNSIPTDVGLDCFNEPLVTDSYYGCIHKFSNQGDYVCSYNFSSYNNPAFNDPKRFSYVGHNKPGWNILDNFMSDGWSANYGIKRYLAGADVFELKYYRDLYYNFSFIASNRCDAKIEILHNNNVIFNQTLSLTWAGINVISLEDHELPIISKDLKFRVYYKPFYDNYYNSYQQGWKYKEISFSTLVAPVISGFTQTPNPIYRGNSGTVTAHLSQGNGNISYSWSHYNLPSGVSVTYNGNKAHIYYGYGKLITEDYSKVPAPTLTCTATNAAGSSTSTTIVYFSSGGSVGGCPFVYTWNGNEYIEDNNILPQSVYPSADGQTEEGLVTDYYQLFTEPVEIDRTYKLRVGEFEQEISTLDQFKLLIVDHIPEAMVSANENGEISLYAKPASLTSANVDDGDVYKLVYEMDDNYVETEPDQSMQLTFEDGQVASDKVMLLVGSSPIKLEPIGAVAKLNGKNINPQEFRFRKNMSYTWVPVNVQNHKETNIDIGINWTGTAKLDYSELSNKLNLDYTLYESELISAEHSQDGDVTSSLQISDGNIVELNPQEWVDLIFTAPPLSEGMKRTFIFVSRGRYERIDEKFTESALVEIKSKANASNDPPKADANKPTRYSLSQNRPNPFNPVTQISYALPEAGYVTLKIYDVLGREVAVLVNDFKEAGYYEATWDARLNGVVGQAANIPSGVFFYTLAAGNYTSVRKMLLAK